MLISWFEQLLEQQWVIEILYFYNYFNLLELEH